MASLNSKASRCYGVQGFSVCIRVIVYDRSYWFGKTSSIRLTALTGNHELHKNMNFSQFLECGPTVGRIFGLIITASEINSKCKSMIMMKISWLLLELTKCIISEKLTHVACKRHDGGMMVMMMMLGYPIAIRRASITGATISHFRPELVCYCSRYHFFWNCT